MAVAKKERDQIRQGIKESAEQPKVGDEKATDDVVRHQVMGEGGFGDTGKARTIEEREKAATASTYKEPASPDRQGVQDTEVEQRNSPTAAEREPRSTFTQESDAYYGSALQEIYRMMRTAVRTGESLAEDFSDRNDAFQTPDSFRSAVEELKAAVDQFQKSQNIPG